MRNCTQAPHTQHTHTHARTHARRNAQIKHTHHADARTHHTRARTALQRVSMSTDVTAATWLEHSSGVMAVHALGTFSPRLSPCLILSQNRAGRLLTRLLRHPPLRTQGKEKADRTQGQQKSVVRQFSGACGGASLCSSAGQAVVRAAISRKASVRPRASHAPLSASMACNVGSATAPCPGARDGPQPGRAP